MGSWRKWLQIEKPVPHHLEDWDVFGLLAKGAKKPKEPAVRKEKRQKKGHPHHLDEGDIFSGMIH